MQKGHRWGQKHRRDGIQRRDRPFGLCRCPNCGYRMSSSAAMPCSSIPCPQCGVPMMDSK